MAVPPESGCQLCTTADAAVAWQRALDLTRDTEIVAESHFRVTLHHCPFCAQPYVRVFAEVIDWADGNDPQDWLLAPVSPAEAQQLTAIGESGVGAALSGLAPRRYLRRWFGREDEAPYTQWTSGIVVLPAHD